MSDFLSRAELLAKKGRRFKVVDLPNVGPVRICNPTGILGAAMRDIYAKASLAADVTIPIEVQAIALQCLVDETGTLILDEEGAQRLLREWSDETLIALAIEVSKHMSEGFAKLGLGPKEEGAPRPPNPSEASPTGG